MDYSVHRLKSYQEILDLRQDNPSRYDSFENKVYIKLLSLEVGSQYSLLAMGDEQSRIMFIKIACMAINEGMDLEFNDEFTRIKRIPPAPPRPGTKNDQSTEVD